jgi:hypothetical protein
MAQGDVLLIECRITIQYNAARLAAAVHARAIQCGDPVRKANTIVILLYRLAKVRPEKEGENKASNKQDGEWKDVTEKQFLRDAPSPASPAAWGSDCRRGERFEHGFRHDRIGGHRRSYSRFSRP